MKIAFQFCILFIFILTSCTKRKEIHVQIYNPVTNQAVSKVPYEIAKYPPSGTWGYSEKQVAKSGLSDENGNIDVSKWIRKNSAYFFKISLPEKYYPSQGSFGKLKNLDKKTNIKLLVAEIGKIDLHVQNVNCNGNADKLTVTQSHDFFIIDNINDNDTIVLSGCFDWSRLKAGQPHGWHYFKSELYKAGVNYIRLDSVYVTPGQTVLLDLKYY